MDCLIVLMDFRVFERRTWSVAVQWKEDDNELGGVYGEKVRGGWRGLVSSGEVFKVERASRSDLEWKNICFDCHSAR